MTNEEKIEKMLKFFHGSRTLKDLLLEMAEWKDREFAEEKKQWIEKASSYIYNNAHVTTFHDIRLDRCSITQFVDIFKKAMEE